MPVIDIQALQIIAILAGVVALISLGVALWALSRARRKPDVKRETVDRGVHQELQTVQEKYSLVGDRVDRYERTFQNLRDDLGQLQSQFASQRQRIDNLEKEMREQQEQIFELREEEKVLMQREDRLERVQQELQDEWAARRQNDHS